MDFTDYIRFVLALAFVLGLIVLATVAARRFGMMPRVTQRKKQTGKRLAIVEIAPIDAKRRLILVRRDEVEHLIVLGTSSELLIESGIAARDKIAAHQGASAETDDVPAVGGPPRGGVIPETGAPRTYTREDRQCCLDRGGRAGRAESRGKPRRGTGTSRSISGNRAPSPDASFSLSP